MASDNTYHIYLHLDELSENSGAMAGTGTGSTGIDKPSSNSSSDRVVKAAKNLVSFAAVKSTADNLISYNISQVSLLTGANEYEQRLATVHSAVSQTVGAGAALIGGAIAGGPAGLAVAAIALAASTVNKVISIQQKEQTLRNQQSLENVSIGMTMVRAGTANRRGGNQ